MSSTKINVAVAGVTSGLGNAIATALLANHSVTVILITRRNPSSTIPEVLQSHVQQGAILRPVDYTSVESIAKALEGVHTVISALYTPQDTTPADNLLDGAKAAGVKRFATSEFSIAKEANSIIQAYNTKISYWEKVKSSGMQYTAFRNGMFMDYFATGSSYSGPLTMYPFVVNVKERKAEIPGTGDDKITFTALADIGKFVSATITWEQWPEELGMSGETLSYNDVVRKAEEVIGEKFSVTYISEEEMKKRKAESIEKGDLIAQFIMEMFSAYLKGMGEIKEPYLNKATDVQPTKVTEFLQKYWSKA